MKTINPMRRSLVVMSIITSGIIFLTIHACSIDPQVYGEWYNEEEYYAGGETTIFEATSGAFSTPAPNLSPLQLEKHLSGDMEFEATFVTAPSPVNAGLGPVFNQTSCVGCHTLDGRGDKPTVFRISTPGTDAHGGPLGVAGFGGAIQDKAIFDVAPEAMVDISYVESTYSFPDGETYSLRKPIYTIINNYAPLPSDVALSVRVAPPVFGLGLLEIIPEEAIIALADEQDADKNGISGKANYVYDVRTGLMALGRFGWKANQPNLDQQNAAAFNEDMGITNPIFQTESCFGQLQFDGITDEPEITMPVLEDVTFYVRTLAVPAPRNLEDANIQEGKMYFYKAGCNTCHNPSFTTGIAINAPELSNQKIYPYTDMLLHDMGDAMGDGRQDYLATGNEWKTRPLWGIGLTQLANGHTVFLHDGRARNLTEAIMWHGGEAEASTEYFESLTKEQRDKLLEFLMAL